MDSSFFISSLCKYFKSYSKKWQTVPLGEIATVKKGDEVGSDNYNKYLDKRIAIFLLIEHQTL